MSNKFLFFLTVIAFSSCVMDRKSGVIVIGNDTNSSILVVKQPEQNITDSLVFLDNLDKVKLNRGETKSIWLPYGNLKNLPAKERAYFYIGL
jgi:hypothetical protein